ncbi:transcriptional regulator LacI family [Janthinobacterium sp. HH01]|uniref:Substrate-binding domain-containing protein n=2 Tax=Rugamonas TaxID=212744 RepID=A0A843SN64_9BURK|nr:MULTISPECIES: LacI family DNA-binding transcriptional regulator [Oxalobacteraceae]ELX11903.1 transcriptional regulator LacI family [Janthinobacterium sp. HH01]MQA22267.1 substrate-binding domain-containing protein [Rugamonas rivuli]MQA38578.1 substrate-binding domain-containing protein [Rugamonas aquatica]OEZ56711.1 putative HTH-type transcriptional repressor ExuR [Duganella sp. HH105]
MPSNKSVARKAETALTMEDLAKLAGVSKITVSRALRDSPLVTVETREKIRALANEQGYRFNVSARNLRMGRSYSVAVVVEMTPVRGRPMSDPYPLELLGGITQELTTAGYSVVLTSKQLMNTAPVQGADGLILLGQGSHGEAVRTLQQTGMPLVVWGAPEPDTDYIVVGSDNRKGGISAAERFIAQGRQKLVFLGDVDHAEVQERCAGFIDAMGGRATVHIIRPKAFTFEAGFDSISALLKKKGANFDGVFAASDLLAMGAIRALAEKNLRVPENVSVIGYDDTPGAASFVPPLTSVHQYLRDGGVLLAKKMLGLIEGHPVASEMLPTTLMVRQT